MSGKVVICCGVRSRRQTRSVTSLLQAYCYTHLNTNLLAAGDPLDNVQGEVEHGLAFARNMRFGLAIDSIAGQLGLIRTLRGLTPTFGCFDDEQFDELVLERPFLQKPGSGVGRGLVLDPQAAGALLCRRLCGRPRGLSEGATAAVDIAVNVRNGGISVSTVRLLSSVLRVRPARARGSDISRLLLPTTDSSKSGRNDCARKTSRTAPRWSVRRSPGSMAARSMP